MSWTEVEIPDAATLNRQARAQEAQLAREALRRQAYVLAKQVHEMGSVMAHMLCLVDGVTYTVRLEAPGPKGGYTLSRKDAQALRALLEAVRGLRALQDSAPLDTPALAQALTALDAAWDQLPPHLTQGDTP